MGRLSKTTSFQVCNGKSRYASWCAHLRLFIPRGTYNASITGRYFEASFPRNDENELVKENCVACTRVGEIEWKKLKGEGEVETKQRREGSRGDATRGGSGIFKERNLFFTGTKPSTTTTSLTFEFPSFLPPFLPFPSPLIAHLSFPSSRHFFSPHPFSSPSSFLHSNAPPLITNLANDLFLSLGTPVSFPNPPPLEPWHTPKCRHSDKLARPLL